VWTQAVSDITGYPQEVVTGPGAAFGDAMLAAMAAGMLDGPSGSRRWVTPAMLITPRREFAALYDRQRELFEQLYRSTRPIVTALDELRNSS
jgi:xylulokinase